MTKDEIRKRLEDARDRDNPHRVERDALVDLLFELQPRAKWFCPHCSAEVEDTEAKNVGLPCSACIAKFNAINAPKSRGQEIAEKLVRPHRLSNFFKDEGGVEIGEYNDNPLGMASVIPEDVDDNIARIRKSIASAIDAAIAEEREACLELIKTWYGPDACTALVKARVQSSRAPGGE